VDFCVFYLQGEALLWWRWLEKKKEGLFLGQTFMKKCNFKMGLVIWMIFDCFGYLKQVGNVQEYYKAFIKIAHLVDTTEKKMISLFLAGLREELRGKVKLDKPLSMVSAYRSACARESIATMERRAGKNFAYKRSASQSVNINNVVRNQWPLEEGEK